MNGKTSKLDESRMATTSRSFRTANLQALLEVIARARREQMTQQKVTTPATGTPLPFLKPDQVQQWFTKERYVMGESVAQGGMARIFCAADLHLCRTVALKTVLENSSAEDLSRFLFEAQITAQLQHPNIIPIYDMGLEKETCLPFFTMKYVSGRTALDIIMGLRRNDPKMRHQFGDITERLTIFLKTCDAIAYAHSLDVVHRDIKPANIMVGNHGEVYVIDWGIAQARNAEPGPDPSTGRLRFNPNRITSYRDIYGLDQTLDQGFLGSPVHMAPEQFINPDTVDERSDVYGLGCTLYELVTLHPPFDNQLTLDRLLAIKRQGLFKPVWKYVPSIRYDLAEIIHKCMASRKLHRYQNVKQLQNSLRKFMETTLAARRKLAVLRDDIRKLQQDEFDDTCRDKLLGHIDAILKQFPGARK